MEAIFSLSYPEYAVAIRLAEYFKKSEGYTVAVPLSRQQKGFDLLLFNLKSKKSVSFQVKSSRTWPSKKPEKDFQYSAWFNKFEPVKEVDYFIFFVLYPKTGLFGNKRLDKKNTNRWWESRILLLGNFELKALFNELKTKKGEPERFFYLGFNEESKDIFITRGSPVKSLKENLLEYQIDWIAKKLE